MRTGQASSSIPLLLGPIGQTSVRPCFARGMVRSFDPCFVALPTLLRPTGLSIDSGAAKDTPNIAPASLHMGRTLAFLDRSILAATLAAISMAPRAVGSAGATTGQGTIPAGENTAAPGAAWQSCSAIGTVGLRESRPNGPPRTQPPQVPSPPQQSVPSQTATTDGEIILMALFSGRSYTFTRSTNDF